MSIRRTIFEQSRGRAVVYHPHDCGDNYAVRWQGANRNWWTIEIPAGAHTAVDGETWDGVTVAELLAIARHEIELQFDKATPERRMRLSEAFDSIDEAISIMQEMT